MPQVANGWYALYKSTSDPANRLPTLNHLVVVNSAGWNQSFSNLGVNDANYFAGPGATMLTYVMWADTETATASAFTNLARTIINNCLVSTNAFAQYVLH